MTREDRITEALSALVGLPMWRATRALNMEMFTFGERRKRLNQQEEEIEVGEYALHVQCPWRIVGPHLIAIGSEDRNYPEDEKSDWNDFDPDADRTLCEARMAAWLHEHARAPLKVERVEADRTGGFRLFLERGFVLEAFPANTLRGEEFEHWRLFQSSQKDHFVVTGRRPED